MQGDYMMEAHVPLDGDAFEALEPFPDPHDLFVLYNDLYFHGSLGATSVQWSSKRMTRCAGTCWYTKGGGCIIKLSEPLLKFRPSIDLKETLLHEMIHAHIFLTNQARRDGDHGPLFAQMVTDINTSTVPDPQRPPEGYHVSVTHTFIAEVRSYQTHHWECKRCGDPVRRAMNRPPQPADCRARGGAACFDERCAYHRHARRCGGEYAKVAEPEGYGDTKRRKRKAPSQEQPRFAANGVPVPPQRPNAKPRPEPGMRSILDFFTRAEPVTAGAASDGTRAQSPPPVPDQARRTPIVSPGARRSDDSPSAKRRLLAEAAERRLAGLQDGIAFLADARQVPMGSVSSSSGQVGGGEGAAATGVSAPGTVHQLDHTVSLLESEQPGEKGGGGEVLRLNETRKQGLPSVISARAEQVGGCGKQGQSSMQNSRGSSSHQMLNAGLRQSSGACTVDLTGKDQDDAQHH